MSGDVMEFPRTPEEFCRQYGFFDKDEVYTNGSLLIPVFRVEQMVEHYFERTCHMSFIDEYETASGEEEYLCECSECGYRRWEPAYDLPLFCSKCGAKVVDE